MTHLFSHFLAQSEIYVPGQPMTADTVIAPYIYVFYAAFLVSFCFTPIMRLVANYFRIIDQPDSLRKMHSVPVAYLGGVAVFLGWLAGMALSQFLRFHRPDPGAPDHMWVNFGIVVAATVILALGLWDDLRGMKPAIKIMGQTAAAMILLNSGIGTHVTAVLLRPLDAFTFRLFAWPPIPDSVIIVTSSMLVVFVVVGCCNATNLMDGLDGLCGGVTAVVSAGFLFLAIHLAMSEISLSPNTDGLRVVLALALLGAVLGFVPYNFNPASIFMGDTGSMFLGFSCATLIIMAGERQHPKWFLAAMIMFALPVLDTALAFARRWVNRRPFFSADRHHFHHQMVARGYSVKQTVIISYFLALAFASLGALIIFMRTRYAVAVYLVIFGGIIVAAYKMGMVHEKSRVAVRKTLSTPSSMAIGDAPDPDSVLEIPDRLQTPTA